MSTGIEAGKKKIKLNPKPSLRLKLRQGKRVKVQLRIRVDYEGGLPANIKRTVKLRR